MRWALEKVTAGQDYVSARLTGYRNFVDWVEAANIDGLDLRFLARLRQGETRQEIAAGLGLNLTTVKHRACKLFKLLDAQNRIDIFRRLSFLTAGAKDVNRVSEKPAVTSHAEPSPSPSDTADASVPVSDPTEICDAVRREQTILESNTDAAECCC